MISFRSSWLATCFLFEVFEQMQRLSVLECLNEAASQKFFLFSGCTNRLPFAREPICQQLNQVLDGLKRFQKFRKNDLALEANLQIVQIGLVPSSLAYQWFLATGVSRPSPRGGWARTWRTPLPVPFIVVVVACCRFPWHPRCIWRFGCCCLIWLSLASSLFLAY